MKRILLCCASLTLGTGLLFGQFGLTVFDPSVYFEAIAQVNQLVQQYNQLVQTYQMITNQYNQMLWMAKQLPGNLARFRAIQTPWFLSAASNTYGTTGGWIGAINTGANVFGGYLSATERLMPYGAALGFVPADQLDRLQKHYATIELTDGANEDGIETIGTLRNNAPEVEAAIQSLELFDPRIFGRACAGLIVEGGGSILEQLILPAIKHDWCYSGVLANGGDRHLFDQMAAHLFNLLLGAIFLAFFFQASRSKVISSAKNAFLLFHLRQNKMTNRRFR